MDGVGATGWTRRDAEREWPWERVRARGGGEMVFLGDAWADAGRRGGDLDRRAGRVWVLGVMGPRAGEGVPAAWAPAAVLGGNEMDDVLA